MTIEDEFPAAVGAEEAAWPTSVRYGAETAEEILRRTAAGESLAQICRSPGMPLANTVIGWTKSRPEFAARMHAARVAAGGPFRGRRPLWCLETAQAIYDRVCAGEAVTAICAEPGMPSMATLTNWRRQHPEFAEALDEAYEIRAELQFEKGLAIAEAVTPETAYATHVRLQHHRWWVGKACPLRYGPRKPVAPADASDGDGDGGGMTVVVKTFTLPPNNAPAVPTTEPAKVLYRIDGQGRRTDGNGEVWAPDADGRRFHREDGLEDATEAGAQDAADDARWR